MKQKKVLHILYPDKFTIPFIHLINKEFDKEDHLFLCAIKPGNELLSSYSNVKYLYSPYRKNFIRNTWIFGNCLQEASKIIMHGNQLLFYFMLFPAAIKRIYWIIMGYELGESSIPEENVPENSLHDQIKKYVLKRVYGHISHIKGDSELANLQFRSDAKFYYSPMYLSNVVSEYSTINNESGNKSATRRILVGNSTCPTNEHLSIFKLLFPYKDDDLVIYCPLSYGDYPLYKNEIIKKGNEMFGNKFIPITNFMPSEEYNHFLNKIDIAIFNHKRQEAMGVTLSLLSMGKIVYLNNQTTSFKSFKERGIQVYDNKMIFNDGLFYERDVSLNPDRVFKNYNYRVLIDTLSAIFNN